MSREEAMEELIEVVINLIQSTSFITRVFVSIAIYNYFSGTKFDFKYSILGANKILLHCE